jgi:hypothetical protein
MGSLARHAHVTIERAHVADCAEEHDHPDDCVNARGSFPFAVSSLIIHSAVIE